MNPYEIDISKLDTAKMIAALYNSTKNPLPLHHRPMTVAEAQAEIDRLMEGEQGNRLYFDYLWNRSMKIHFGREILDTRLYDRDNGQGAAAAALAPLLDSLENV
jgi:hypothetical protein